MNKHINTNTVTRFTNISIQTPLPLRRSGRINTSSEIYITELSIQGILVEMIFKMCERIEHNIDIVTVPNGPLGKVTISMLCVICL